MTQFVQGIKTLFTGPDTGAQQQQIKQQQDAQAVALTRQQQTEQASDDEQTRQQGLISRQPRGRRLLLASTGESGVSKTLGG